MKKKTKARTRSLGTLIAAVSLFAASIIAPSAAVAEDQYYYVANQGTNMVAEVFAHSQADSAPVVLWPNYGGESEQFKKVDLNGGAFALVARHSGKCLAHSWDTKNNAVLQTTCGALGSQPYDFFQIWVTREVQKTASDCGGGPCFGGSRTVLVNYWAGWRNCLDSANGNAPAPPKQGAGLQTWPCIKKFSDWNAVNQDWRLVKTQDWGGGPNVH
ncbi:RICIN domain-containing protein [Streptomyces nojiriensis]|uniref:RICIN domain-containing protein n=1 Tax=Streptomyces nojiriensis TaxID=66374 RepID=UPI0036DA38B6